MQHLFFTRIFLATTGASIDVSLLNEGQKIMKQISHVFLILVCLLGNESYAENTNMNGSAQASTPPTSVITINPKDQDNLVQLDDKELFQFAFKQIEFEAKRLDRLIANAEIVGGLVAAIILAFAAIISFLGLRNIRELKSEVQGSVKEHVKSALHENSETAATFDRLISNLDEANRKWGEIKESIENLEQFSNLTDSQYSDAQAAYRLVRMISEREDPTEEERKTALGFLLKIISLGSIGKVDPNILFNSSTAASSLDFEFEALQLASLCAIFDPKISHKVRRHRHEDTFGVRFELIDSVLKQTKDTPKNVREEAWSTLRTLIKENPTHQCELVYSEFHNIATRNRELGYYDDSIKAIEELLDNNENHIPSYAYTILSGFYVLRGGQDWQSHYEKTVESAISQLKSESPLNTWYNHTARDLMQMADRIGKIDWLQQKLS